MWTVPVLCIYQESMQSLHVHSLFQIPIMVPDIHYSVSLQHVWLVGKLDTFHEFAKFRCSALHCTIFEQGVRKSILRTVRSLDGFSSLRLEAVQRAARYLETAAHLLVLPAALNPHQQ